MFHLLPESIEPANQNFQLINLIQISFHKLQWVINDGANSRIWLQIKFVEIKGIK